MFTELFDSFSWGEVTRRIMAADTSDVKRSMNLNHFTPEDLLPFFSPAAEGLLEEMANLSSRITRMRFGNTIQLYTPLYISNECTNSCLYCGFNRTNDIRRITLSTDDVEKEAEAIFSMGFRHVLLLTGEHRGAVPVEKLAEIAGRIHKKFASVAIEVYPMETEEYRLLVQNGIDGLTLYQETYNRDIYAKMHPAGRKRDFNFRLEGPDRGGAAGLRKIGIGALLGLADWRTEGFFTALHALYLSSTYWRTHIMVSFPRMREAPGGFNPLCIVQDREMAQLLCAMRIILPDAGLVLSTREPADLRDNLFPLGVTMMSAGSKTEPGGYTEMDAADVQFNIEDSRTPEEIARVISSKGFDPVWKDWDRDFLDVV